MNKKQQKVLKRILLTIVLVVVLNIIPKPANTLVDALLWLIPYYVIGNDILLKAYKGICRKQVFDENFLMAIATIGAYFLGEFMEATAVMLFYQIGELFQSYAIGKSRQSISSLMDIRPDYANVYVDDALQQVDPDEVEVGTIIVVQPGEKVPIDGVVVSGCSSLNTSALTGESVPKQVNEGSEIYSGCVNNEGVLKIQTTKPFMESTVSKILDLVENASSLKSKSEAFITKFAHYYTPIVCYAALALAIIPPVVLITLGKQAAFGLWLYRALTFLVISCPCALVISIPLSFFAGLGGASKEGILIKGSNYLETLAQVKNIVFDKTGTITKGVFEVVACHSLVYNQETLLKYSAYSEFYSSHPIALGIKKAYGQKIDESLISDVKEVSGHGILATIDNHQVAIGNHKLMEQLALTWQKPAEIGTIIHVAIDKQYAGYLVIADVIKEEAASSMQQLEANGVTKTIMLTGDNEIVAKDVASKVGIKECYYDLLPQDKVSKLEEILQKASGKVAFVGDGINDAPVLTRADVGIAMGALGSDAAIEAADVVLMDDDLGKIAKAIKIARKCIRIVYENIYFAIGVKVVCLVLTAIGLSNMWLGIFADVGVMVIAVLNAIRALFVKDL